MTDVHPLLEETRDLLAAPLAGCTPEQVMQHPANDPARWNAHQVIEHLAASWRSTTKGIEDRLQKGRPLLTRPTSRQRVAQLAVCFGGVFPKGRQAPPEVRPPDVLDDTLSGNDVIASFSAVLTEMDATLSRMERDAGGRVVLTHFVLGPLNVDRWRRFHRTHARHHARQIRSAVST